MRRMHHGERFNGYSHLFGLLLALAGGALLLGKALSQGDAARIAGALVFGGSMVALYAASTLFHSSRGASRLFWQRADHCAIYLLIAGTCTPFALVALQGIGAWLLLGALWSGAIFGIARELRGGAGAAPSLPLYVGMGWLAVLAAVPLAARLDRAGLVWLIAGALLYSGGTVFYRNRRGWRHAHGLWHLAVLGGSACHFVAIAWFVL